jgi:hypothetical protein
MSTPSRIVFSSLSLLLASVTTQTAIAQQAWVGEPGSLSLSLDYSYSRSDKVLAEAGEDVADIDPIFSHIAALGIEYTPIDKLALIATIPVVASSYDYDPGQTSLPPHGRYDDGDTHVAPQDFRLDLRYMVLDDVVTLSPHLSVSIPMSNYETVGYASAGRGLKMLVFGAALGKYFTSGVPDLYIHGRYEFRWVEGYETAFPETSEYSQNRSFMDVLLGYYILDELEVNVAANLQHAHGGFEFANFDDEPPVAQYFHDALLAEGFLHVGGGVSYQAMEKLRVSAFVRFFIRGENTRNSDIYGLGLSWDAM